MGERVAKTSDRPVTGARHRATADSICRITRTVECDAGPLFVQETVPETGRDGDYVLFVHGNTFPSSPDFDLCVPGYSFVEHLAARGVSCCMFDHRGYGRSVKPRPGEAVGLEARARDLEAVYWFLRKERGAASITLLGLSTGCNTIAELLGRSRLELRALVLLGPCYLFNDFLSHAANRARLIHALRAVAGREESEYIALPPAMLIRRLYKGEEELIDRRVLDEFLRQSIRSTWPSARKLVSPVLAFPDWKQRYQPMQPMFDAAHLASAPILMLRGGVDTICDPATARAFLDACRAAGGEVTEVCVPERKHDLHLYKKHDRVFSSIVEFVRS